VSSEGSTSSSGARRRTGRSGPDESYSFGTRRDVPDLAFEVVHGRWRVDKLEVYRGLGVSEVWLVREGVIHVHRLEGQAYVVQPRSSLLPDLDLDLVARHATPGASLTAAVRAFRAALAAPG